jgi:DNA-binding response OmpR family regulator
MMNGTFYMTNSNSKYHAGKLILDTDSNRVSLGPKIIHLTEREYKILEYLMRHLNTVIPRKKLLQDLWGNSFETFSNVIDVHIKNLRKKIEARNSAMIETVRGVGYKLREC